MKPLSDRPARQTTRAGRLRVAGAVLLAAASLSACYVLPMDPQTGRPVLPAGMQAAPASTSATAADGPRTVLVAAPAAPATPAQLQARLYPVNEQAQGAGMLLANVSDNRAGRGQISFSYRGDLMQGEATHVEGGAGFGRVHAEALGPAARQVPAGRRGIANMVGSKGVSAQCEYVMTAPAIGTGACVFSDGAKYQLHFGG